MIRNLPSLGFTVAGDFRTAITDSSAKTVFIICSRLAGRRSVIDAAGCRDCID